MAIDDKKAHLFNHQEFSMVMRRSSGCTDIVCFTPHLDATRITALNASSILHELVTVMADRIKETP